MAVFYLEFMNRRCVNCDVYGWKQVKTLILCQSILDWLEAGGRHRLSSLLPPLQPAEVLLQGVPGGALGEGAQQALLLTGLLCGARLPAQGGRV